MATAGPSAAIETRAIHAGIGAPLSSFVGREADLRSLESALAGARLLTLTGAAGVGKSRLAQQLAQRLTKADSGRPVGFVHLAAEPSDAAGAPPEERVAEAVCAALALPATPVAQLGGALAALGNGAGPVLVLDGCERLLDACARVTSLLLRASHTLAVITTSRAPLAIAGEARWRVGPMSLPPEQLDNGPAPDYLALPYPQVTALPAAAGGDPGAFGDAVRLFAARAAAVRPDFQLTAESLPTVAAICRQLDGIPLAIEHAAARARSLSLQEILALVEQDPASLASDLRDTPPAHRSLGALAESSVAALPEPERRLLARLSVFAGSFDLAAALAVCGDHQEGAGPARCEGRPVAELLESLVDHSMVECEPETPLGARYRLLRLVRLRAASLLDPEHAERLRERHLTHYAALAHAAGPELYERNRLAWFARLDADYENVEGALRFATQGPLRAQPDPLARALRMGAGLFQYWQVRGRLREGLAWLNAALALPRDPSCAVAVAEALMTAGEAASYFGDRTTRGGRLYEAYAIAERLGDRRLRAHILRRMGRSQDALELARELGERRIELVCLQQLAERALQTGDVSGALGLLRQSVALVRELGGDLPTHLVRVARVLRLQGDLEGARPLFEECLATWRRLRFGRGTASVLTDLGEIAAATGDPETARAYFLDSLRWHRLSNDGNRVTLTHGGLALLAFDAGDMAEASAWIGEALRYWKEYKTLFGAPELFDALAVRCAAQGRHERAIRLAMRAEAIRERQGISLPPRVRERLDAGLAPAVEAVDAARAEALAHEGTSLPIEELLAQAVDLPQYLLPGPSLRSAAGATADAAGGQTQGQGQTGASRPETEPSRLPRGGAARFYGRLYVDSQFREVLRGQDPLPQALSPQEFTFLSYLFERTDRVCTHAELGDAIWGAGNWDQNLLHHLARRVRRKVEPEPSQTFYLRAVRGVGFRLTP